MRLWFPPAAVLTTLLLTPLAPALAQQRGEKYALLVGVREYDPNELRSLPYSEADAEGLAKVLLDSGYKPLNVVLMTQNAGAKKLRFLPTAERIRKELDLLIQDTTADDLILVAFAGHGVQFRGETESYFCPADARLNDKSTLVSLSEIYKALERCPAGFKLLMVDACRNDPQSDNSRARSVVNLESVTRPQAQLPPGGVVAMFSCSPGEKAYEHSDLKHGVFFHSIIAGLAGAATDDKSGGVTLPELELYTKKAVRDFVRAEYGVRQMPELVGNSRGLVPLVTFNRGVTTFKRAKSLAESGDIEQSISLLTEAIRLNPGLAAAYFERGKLRARKREFFSAIEDFNAAINRNLTSAGVYNERGRAYYATNQLDWSIADHTEAIRLSPSLAISYVLRADPLNDKLQMQQAMADCNKAIALDPACSEAFRNRGDSYERLKDYARAIADYNESIRLDPKNARAYKCRGVTYSWLSNFDQLYDDLSEAIRLDPMYAKAYDERGKIKTVRGQDRGAQAAADQAWGNYLNSQMKK